MSARNARRDGAGRTRLARTEKELKAESGGQKAPRKIVLPVKVAKSVLKEKAAPARPDRAGPDAPATAGPARDNGAPDSNAGRPAPKRAAGDFAALVERQKRLIIYSGVTFFMVVIAALWALGLGADLSASRWEMAAGSRGQGLDDLTGELARELDRIRGELDRAAVTEEGGQPVEGVFGALPAAPSASLGTGPSASLGTGPSASLGTGPSASLGTGATSTLITPELVERLRERLE